MRDCRRALTLTLTSPSSPALGRLLESSLSNLRTPYTLEMEAWSGAYCGADSDNTCHLAQYFYNLRDASIQVIITLVPAYAYHLLNFGGRSAYRYYVTKWTPNVRLIRSFNTTKILGQICTAVLEQSSRKPMAGNEKGPVNHQHRQSQRQRHHDRTANITKNYRRERRSDS
jgi:hypothetical protein